MCARENVKARIVVETDTTRVWGQAEKVAILLDGQTLDSIQCGKQGVFFVEIGSHTLQAKIGAQGSEIVRFRIMENDLLNFRCYVTGALKANVALLALFRRTQAGPRFGPPGLSPGNPGQPRFGRRYTDAAPWHEVLNVARDASFEQITAAYLASMKDYHPEKMAGMSEVDKQYAMSQAKKISAAYAEVKKIRG